MDLFIDSSNSYLIFVLFKEDKVIDSYSELTNKNQSEIFFERLDTFLKKSNIEMNEINNFYFASGPGSFTGIRVGLTFAKGLLVSNFQNVYSISSLELLLSEDENSYACIDAHNNKFFVLEKKDGTILNEKLIKKEDLVENYNTYENSLSNIPKNVVGLVKEKRFNQNLNPTYLKEAF